MSDTTAWKEYCEASLDLSNQDEVGETQMLGCYQTLEEADLALDAYSNRYPNAYLFIK